jgi:hypothetical protein
MVASFIAAIHLEQKKLFIAYYCESIAYTLAYTQFCSDISVLLPKCKLACNSALFYLVACLPQSYSK